MNGSTKEFWQWYRDEVIFTASRSRQWAILWFILKRMGLLCFYAAFLWMLTYLFPAEEMRLFFFTLLNPVTLLGFVCLWLAGVQFSYLTHRVKAAGLCEQRMSFNRLPAAYKQAYGSDRSYRLFLLYLYAAPSLFIAGMICGVILEKTL
jgi:uncharacterized membrane protein